MYWHVLVWAELVIKLEGYCRACTAGGLHRRSVFMSMLCQIQYEDVILSLWGDTSLLPCFRAHCKQAACSVPHCQN